MIAHRTIINFGRLVVRPVQECRAFWERRKRMKEELHIPIVITVKTMIGRLGWKFVNVTLKILNGRYKIIAEVYCRALNAAKVAE